MKIFENFDLKHFNTFRVSAHARYFVKVETLAELRKALTFCRNSDLPYMLIGQGSNLLFKQDYPGLIIELNIKGIELVRGTVDHYYVRSQCGEIWHDFVLYCLSQGYYGLENLSLIPGTVGAAPVQNIGAYGVEVSDFLHELTALEVDSGKLRTFTNEECQLGYRTSVFKGAVKNRYIICDVTFRLLKTPKLNLSYPALKSALDEVPEEELTPLLVSQTVCDIRQSKLPDPGTVGNAGSFFWNPLIEPKRFDDLRAKFPEIPGYPAEAHVKVPAAWLIDQAGWKGYRHGDVGVHKDHALVLVNHGEATGSELFDLSVRIQASVKAMFGIDLQPEVRII